MVNDTVADLLTRIRNAQRIGRKSVSIPYFRVGEDFLKLIRDEGFVQGFEVKESESSAFKDMEVTLKYYSNGDPAIRLARKVSKGGCRVYKRASDLPQVFNGLGVAIVSTSQGLLSDREARKRNIGGEVLAYLG